MENKFKFLLMFVLLAWTGIQYANAYDFEVDGIYYNVISQVDLTCEVTSKDRNYDAYSGDITIPSSVNYKNTTYTVTSIGAYAFRGCYDLKSVTIPPTITKLTAYAFYDSKGIESVNIPNTVDEIGYATFFGCTFLKDITIPDAVNKIGNEAFAGCKNLKSINIPYGVTVIGQLTFRSCSALEYIEIPNSVTSIEYNAFNNCENLKSVKLSNSLIEISSAFWECSSLTSVDIPDSVISLQGSFAYCSNLSSVKMSNSVQEIGLYTFLNCTSLTSLALPSSVSKLGQEVFRGCSNLKSLTIFSTIPPQVNSSFVDLAVEECVLRVPASSVSAYKKADEWCAFFNIVPIQNVEMFKQDNSEILSKTVEDIKSSDLDAINKALDDYSYLSDEEKLELTEEKHLLDLLKERAEELKISEVQIEEFQTKYGSIVELTIETVQSKDIDAINRALKDYEGLSENAKTALANEKKHLEELLSAAEAKKKAEEEEAQVQAEVAKFMLDNAYVLSRTTESVQSNDLDAINKALADYEKLSDKAKDVLKDTKSNLDALKITAEEKKQAEEQEKAVQAEIAKFKLDNAYILSRSIDVIQSNDLAAIDKALSDFDKLSDDAKAVLAYQKELLDALKEKAEEIKKAEEEAAAVEKEVTEFCYNNGEVLTKTTDSVTAEDLDAINKALADYENLSDKAKEELSDIKEHLDELKEEAEAQKQTAEDVKNFKNNNKEILDKTVEDVRPDDLDAINKALEDYDNLSDRAKDELADVKEHLNELKEEAEAQKQTAEDIKKFKDNNKEILDKTVADVTPDDIDAIDKALEDYEKLSDRAKDELADVKNHLDELKKEAETQKQTAEDVKEFKDNNKEILDKTVADVTPDDLDAINKALEDYENLSDRAKEELAKEKELLDALKEKAESLGISSICADEDQNVKTYDLQGHIISNNAKGLIIQNGKKVYRR